MRVPYMSGYTDDATAIHGAFWVVFHWCRSPFTPGSSPNGCAWLDVKTTEH
jgi:hypothetical protein